MSTPIDRDTLATWMRAGAAFELVDTLPAAAYARHHLPGASHIVSDDIEAEAPRRLPDRDRTVVVYCGSTACQRSAKAAARLDALGWHDVREYVEGRQDWEAAGLPVATGPDPEGRA